MCNENANVCHDHIVTIYLLRHDLVYAHLPQPTDVIKPSNYLYVTKAMQRTHCEYA